MCIALPCALLRLRSFAGAAVMLFMFRHCLQIDCAARQGMDYLFIVGDGSCFACVFRGVRRVFFVGVDATRVVLMVCCACGDGSVLFGRLRVCMALGTSSVAGRVV